ncbi:UPF0147 family protein [Candidatus Woesearchaeota archaeon]|nr:UPF0147 family protein [Candidatus Woesearchaeota archaeon]
MKEVNGVIDSLKGMEEDQTIPKNVRLKVNVALKALEDQNGKSFEVKVDQALQALDELSDNPNIPAYARAQIWLVVSALEGLQ